MKFAGLVSLCTAIALTGLYLSFVQNKRIKLIREISAFFCDTGNLCSAGFSDLTGIFGRLSEMKKYKELKAVFAVISRYESGENLKEIWDGAIRTCCPFYINSEIKSLLLSFSEVFGKCTKEDFIRRCSDFSSFAEKLLSEEQKRYEKNRSMTVYSGVLTAAALFFIFI